LKSNEEEQIKGLENRALFNVQTNDLQRLTNGPRGLTPGG